MEHLVHAIEPDGCTAPVFSELNCALLVTSIAVLGADVRNARAARWAWRCVAATRSLSEWSAAALPELARSVAELVREALRLPENRRPARVPFDDARHVV